MDQKKAIVLGVGIIAVFGLLAVVYSQISPEKDVPASSSSVSEKKSVPISEPVADPETPADVMASIEAQLAEEEKAFDDEVAAEAAGIEAEINSMNELGQSYDENEL